MVFFINCERLFPLSYLHAFHGAEIFLMMKYNNLFLILSIIQGKETFKIIIEPNLAAYKYFGNAACTYCFKN